MTISNRQLGRIAVGGKQWRRGVSEIGRGARFHDLAERVQRPDAGCRRDAISPPQTLPGLYVS